MRRLILALALCLAAAPVIAARIKDISVLRTARDSQLVGYGLVVGLQGSGDTLRNAPFTEQSVQAMLTHLGLDVHGASLRNRNVASVIVTADLSAGVETASRLDVTVSALGDAPSLMGGTLLLTQLQAADGTVYASAQGAVSVTGFDAVGQGETLSQGVPTAGRIPNGAIVEHELPGFADELRSMLELKNPDYATAVRIVDAINAYSRERFRVSAAYEVDSRRVELFRPRRISFARFMSEIGELQVDPDMAARVVLDARTGTVVVGQDVQISTVAVTYGTLTVRVAERPRVSQPAPFSNGRTVVTPNTRIDVEQGGGPIAIVGGSSLRALVSGLNRIGVKPPGIIAILQAIKTAGALQADLVIQ
jgi:flagellar P-ring protein FlgI